MKRIVLAVALVGGAVAGGMLVSSGLAEPTAAPRGPTAENVTALRKERRDTLRQAVEQAVVLHRNARIDDAVVRRITINLLNAELDLAANHGARIAIRKHAVEQFKAIEEVVAAQVESGRAAGTDLLEAKATRLQAEIDLLLETADGK